MESRVRASPEQLSTLLEYMETHGDLARPLAGSQGRVRSDRLWTELTNILNAVGGGVSKTTDKWKKVWADWKSKTKKKALTIRHHARGTGGGPASGQTLSASDERVLAIMGALAVAGQVSVEELGFNRPLNTAQDDRAAQDDPVTQDDSVYLEIVDAEGVEEETHSSVKRNMAGMSTSGPTEAHRLRDNAVRNLQAAVRTKQAAVDDQKAKMYRYFFKYEAPEPDFDSRRVMGTIGSLINDYDHVLTTALEVVAGDQLYSVVVDSQETSLLLMKTGNLPRNTNFIALNQLKPEVIHRELVVAAQEIAGEENVQLALNMITYDIEYEPAMKFVFGNTLICKTMQTALKLAYFPGLQYRVVTLDGDDVNPNGSLTGGVAPEEGALTQREKLAKLQVELDNAEEDLSGFMKYQYSFIAPE